MSRADRRTRPLVACLLAVAMIIAVLTPSTVSALPAAQDPATEAIIDIEADGLAPFDSTTFDPATGTGAGTDGDGANGVVRNFDSVTYNVELSLNDADDTNLIATVVLNDKASWAALPLECKTVAQGSSVTPDSAILDTTNDGLFDTLICNVGDHNEGTKVLIKPVATATGNNTDLIQASVMSSSDNNVNTSGPGGTQGDGPVDTVITAGFGIGITKLPCGFVEQDDNPNETDCNPLYFDTDEIATGSPEMNLVPWHITLSYDPGSEFVADNGSGTQDFTITDTWVGTHSDDPTVEGDNASGDFDDQIVLGGTLTGNVNDSCVLDPPIAGATVTCTQSGPGEPITIQLNGVPVNQQPLANVIMTMGVEHPAVFDPNGDGIESYDINNTATLTGWGGTGALVTSGSGTVDPGPEIATEDFVLNSTNPGPITLYKTFDQLSVAKSGARATAPGSIVATSMVIIDGRFRDTRSGICDTLDTTSFEYAGYTPVGQIDGAYQGRALNSIIDGAAGPQPIHYKNNPVIRLVNAPGDIANTSTFVDALPHGVTIEFSDVDYATTGDDHWSATCQDDLTGDGVSDWVTDPTTLPGGESSVVRIRVEWDRIWSDMTAIVPSANNTALFFSFDLMVQPTATIGTRLPNTASTKVEDHPIWERPAAVDWWLPTNSFGSNVPFERAETDPTNPLYSFNTTNNDRVLVLPASMSIDKTNNPPSPGPFVAGDLASFTIDPNVVGTGPADQTMTFTDTLPAFLSYVGDDCAAAYAAVGLTCAVAVSGQTVTWTVTGYTIGDDLPPFGLDTEVGIGLPAGTYVNKVEISSSYATLSDTSHCDGAVDGNGNPAEELCISRFELPHEATASIQVLSEAGVEVFKSDTDTITEPLSAYSAVLTYANLGGDNVGEGQIIDILPYNGDGVLAPNYSPQRFNFENPTNVNTATQTADPDGAVDFVSITGSAAGEIFEYSVDPHATIDHRPCHPDNWPAGDDETTNPTIALVCERGLIDPATDVPTAGTAGTGATTWGPVPANPADVTAIRASTPVFPGGEPPRDLLLEMNTAYAIEGDLYCNNFGANADIITLDIISNDVCVEVVAGSIGDFVWHDENSDGVQDPGEAPLPGVDMKLLVEDPNNPGTFIPFQVPDPNNPGQFIDYVVTTDANGEYLFENLPSGNYQVMVDTSTLPPDAQQTFDANGPLDNASDVSLFGPNNPETEDSVYTDVDDNRDQDFGYVWPQVDMALTKTTTATVVVPGQDVTFTIEVNNQGDVDMAFANVADYIPAGFTMSPADTNGWTIDGTNPTVGGETGTVYATVAGPITAGSSATIDIVLTVDPGATAGDLVNVAEITGMEDTDGRVRTDDDVDSTADNDPGNDPGGTPGTGEDNHIDDDGTDSDGDGIADEDDSDPALVTVFAPTPAIDIEKDTNGVQSDDSPGELIAVGDPITWTYVVTNTGSTALANATVGDDQGVVVDCGTGSNVIPLLVPGQSVSCTGTGVAQSGPYSNNATVSGDPVLPDFSTCGCDPSDPATWPTDPAGYTPAIGADGQPLGPVDDTDSSHYTGADSNNSIGDYVWFDTNGDGIQDPTESPAAGIIVNLYDDQGNVIATTTTDANGFYEFAGLPDGIYEIEFVAPAGYEFTEAGQGTDGAADSNADPFGRSGPIDLDSAGESDEGINDPTIDAGLVLPQGLGGVVWFDTNGDGVQDPDEQVVPGVLVELLDVDGNPVLDEAGNPITTVTGPDGSYFFPTLPGDYQIRFTPGPETEFSTGPGSDNDLIDFLNGITGIYTVNAGEIVPGIDAALIPQTLAFTGVTTMLGLLGGLTTAAVGGLVLLALRRRERHI